MQNPPLSQPAAPRARLLIVEDQASIREMLAEVLSHMPEFEVVGQADTLDDALRVARQTQPDVVILDWMFPGGGGEAFLREMRPNRLQSRVLVLSGRTEEETVNAALMLGARGYFEKGGNLEEFMTALRTVVAGGAYFGPVAAAIVKRLLDAKTAPRPEKPDVVAPALVASN